MADRSFHYPQTQGIKHVNYNFSMIGQGATGPTLGEGDIAGNRVGSYVSVSRGASGVAGVTGTTGTYLVQTKDAFVALVRSDVSLMFNTKQDGTWTVEFAPPVRQTDGTWIIPFTTYQSGVATDVPANANNRMMVSLVLRNSSVTP